MVKGKESWTEFKSSHFYHAVVIGYCTKREDTVRLLSLGAAGNFFFISWFGLEMCRRVAEDWKCTCRVPQIRHQDTPNLDT